MNEQDIKAGQRIRIRRWKPDAKAPVTITGLVVEAAWPHCVQLNDDDGGRGYYAYSHHNLGTGWRQEIEAAS
ncbi:hypothetical protein ACH4FX_11975 [Streptomyces sp. NPDC018019]|uniref:hypothetical protein n=1 Tax=Streptomyces sp. NPDC018019 TaxID=3365030 RepID=UPI0037A228D6